MVERLAQDPTDSKWQSWNPNPGSLDFCTMLYILSVLPLSQPPSPDEILCEGQYVKQLLFKKKKKA